MNTKTIQSSPTGNDTIEKMDKVIVRQLKLETIIGLFPWEREVRQRLFVDLEIGADIKQAAANDELEHTINYAEVCDRVATLADDGRFKLIETFAEKIAALVLNDFTAEWVKVSVTKVDAMPQVASVGVTIERTAKSTASF
ncbi:MAG: dihydroneopterin aldolase [Cellvibrionaceae bacterium]|jgi:dihydroneopterin aldolase